MSQSQENNFAYIDGSNLHKGVLELGWKLEYKNSKQQQKEKALD